MECIVLHCGLQSYMSTEVDFAILFDNSLNQLRVQKLKTIIAKIFNFVP